MFCRLRALCENRGTGGRVRGELCWLFNFAKDVGADDA